MTGTRHFAVRDIFLFRSRLCRVSAMLLFKKTICNQTFILIADLKIIPKSSIGNSVSLFSVSSHQRQKLHIIQIQLSKLYVTCNFRANIKCKCYLYLFFKINHKNNLISSKPSVWAPGCCGMMISPTKYFCDFKSHKSSLFTFRFDQFQKATHRINYF